MDFDKIDIDEIINGEEEEFLENIDSTKKLTIHQQKLFEEKHWYFKYRIKTLKRLLKGYILTKNADILDIGIGTGTISKYLEELGNVVHVECNPDIINFNSEMNVIKGLFPWKVSLPDKKFDYIVLLNLLEYNNNIKWILDVAKSYLKPNGKIIISTLAGKTLNKNDILYDVKQRFSLQDISDLLNDINMKIYFSTYFQNLSMAEHLKEGLHKFLEGEEVFWNKIPKNNDLIFNYLNEKELPKLGISKINNGNQLFIIAEVMTKEDIEDRTVKNVKNNRKISLLDRTINTVANKLHKNENTK